MKLQIDTDNKTIKIEEKVNLFDLMNKLQMLFPNDTWKEYTLESTQINNWSNPVYIQPYQQIWNQPYYNPFEVYCGTSNTYQGPNLRGGVSTLSSSNTIHNVEIN